MGLRGLGIDRSGRYTGRRGERLLADGSIVSLDTLVARLGSDQSVGKFLDLAFGRRPLHESHHAGLFVEVRRDAVERIVEVSIDHDPDLGEVRVGRHEGSEE